MLKRIILITLGLLGLIGLSLFVVRLFDVGRQVLWDRTFQTLTDTLPQFGRSDDRFIAHLHS